jgi:hypothetical protein
VKIKNEQALKTLTSAFGQSLLENSAWETKIKGFPFSNSAIGIQDHEVNDYSDRNGQRFEISEF